MICNLPLFSGTVTANGSGQTFDIGDMGQLSLASFLEVTAASGTSPTLTVTVQDSPDGTNWFTLLTHTQQTTTGSDVQRTLTATGRYVRVSYAVGGTSPSFTFSVQLIVRG